MKHSPLITGTLFLTAAGLFSRFLGFFYRIFLSRTIGAEGLGIYQMTFPIHGIAFALCAGPIQTSISRLTAANPKKGKQIFNTGLVISLTIAFFLLFFIERTSSFLAKHVLLEPRCEALLPILALSIPFSSVHACICGYYYGLKKTAVPAFSQLIEQMFRIGSVAVISHVALSSKTAVSVSLALWGMLIGEAASAVFSFLVYSFTTAEHTAEKELKPGHSFFSCFSAEFRPLMVMALPLMGNRLFLHLLQSLEAVFVPNKLISYGYSNSEALSLFGVLTGMTLPFIFFPSVITNSMAVLLLPAVSEANAQNDCLRMKKTVSLALHCSLYLGILCIGIFTFFGNELGLTVYQNKEAGHFMQILAWLCPFLYLSSSTASILNGLGKTSSVFLHNCVSMLFTLGAVVFLIPAGGIHAYLIALLCSEILLTCQHIHTLKRSLPIPFSFKTMLLKPALCLILSTGLYLAVTPLLPLLQKNLPFELLFVLLKAGLLALFYSGFLVLFHKNPFKNSVNI